MSRKPSAPPTSARSASPVIAINEAAALYLTLADAIQGAAVGLSPAARCMLRRGLIDRFGPIVSVGGDEAVDELVRLATEPRAA